MFREKTVEHSENLRELREEFGTKVWDPLPLRIAWSEASTLRRPVFNVAPKNPASRDAWNIVMNVEKIKIAADLATTDEEATRHFVLPIASVKNINPASNPLIITIADD